MFKSRHPLRPLAWAFLALVPAPLAGLPLAGGEVAARLEKGFALALFLCALAAFLLTREGKTADPGAEDGGRAEEGRGPEKGPGSDGGGE